MSSIDAQGDMNVYLKQIENQLESTQLEKQKLQTRLKGYETVAKLATEKQNENKELKKQLQEVQRALANSRHRADKRENLQSSDDLVLADLQTATSSPSPSGNSNSTSFSVIGKSSRDSHLMSNYTTNDPSNHSLHTTGANSSGHQNKAYGTKETKNSLSHSDKKVDNNNTQGEDQDESKSENVIVQPEESESLGSLDEFIQVFPEGSQSGGSNFYGASFDQEIGGGQSCTNSSRRGPLSLLAVSHGSSFSHQFVEVKRDDEKKEAVQNEDCDADPFDTKSVSKHVTDLGCYNGTGARPKVPVQPKSTSEENCDREEDTVCNGGNKSMMVKIPQNDEMYRINNPPMLPYGRETSQTEISALTSFGSSLPSMTPEKDKKELHYNNLNMESHHSLGQLQTREMSFPSKIATEEEFIGQQPFTIPKVPENFHYSLATQAQMIRNIWSSKAYMNETRNIILPFLERVEQLEKNCEKYQIENEHLRQSVQTAHITQDTRAHSADLPNQSCGTLQFDQQGKSNTAEKELREANNALMKDVEILRTKTNQLFAANKEWKDRWDLLKKQKEDEKWQLYMKVEHLARQKLEVDNVVTSLRDELYQATSSRKESDKAYKVLLSGRSNEKQLLEKLKQDYGNLHQEKRALEIELESMKAQKKHEVICRPPESINSELETELAVVKRQVTLFMDDFNSEHRERLAVENRLQKEKEVNQSLENKLKKTHALLKSRDDDLRKKSKSVADLQYEVDDLKLKLEIEQRRPSIYPSINVPPGTNLRLENATQKSKKSTLKTWNCQACTFQNTKASSICEMCGTTYVGIEGRYVELDSPGP